MRTHALLLFALASPLAAQTAAHPNFTGTWILDASKSVVSGPIPGNTAATFVVVHQGDSLNVDQKATSEQGDIAMKKVWRVDGKEWTNYMSYAGTDMTLTSVLSWNGAVLTINTNSDFQGTPVHQTETWALDSTAKILTIHTSTVVNGEEYASLTMVFNKK